MNLVLESANELCCLEFVKTNFGIEWVIGKRVTGFFILFYFILWIRKFLSNFHEIISAHVHLLNRNLDTMFSTRNRLI